MGYTVFPKTQKSHNLNIVGVRCTTPKVNSFDDYLHVFWEDMSGVKHKFYPITTYPGLNYLLNPFNILGTAILVPGQYLRAYSIGYYSGYKALRQVRDVSVYRDLNKDSKFDSSFKEKLQLSPSTIKTGLFGIHIHKAAMFSKIVGLNSAGCQVFQVASDFNEFMSICSVAAGIWGNKFTYTLLNEE